MKTTHNATCGCCDEPIVITVDENGWTPSACPVHGTAVTLDAETARELMRRHAESQRGG